MSSPCQDLQECRQNETGVENPANKRADAHATPTLRNHCKPLTISELAEHYRQRELKPDTVWKTYSTKLTYEGYLRKWILPRWGNYLLTRINAGEVELWLRSLPLARSSCAKARNLMSVLFNHGIRHDICGHNPIRLVRQSSKRRQIPAVLSVADIQKLLPALPFRERTLVLLDVGTGLRMSELLALKRRSMIRSLPRLTSTWTWKVAGDDTPLLI
jgi:integrase